jgi:ribonucleoside-triphosphate reductase
MLIVIKRDGREDIFDPNKISNAIKKAFIEVDGFMNEESKSIIDRITTEISNIKREKMSVEEIQDIVEKKLMQSIRKDIAKAYILYRNERTKVRDRNSKLVQKVMERVNSEVDNRSNANVDEKSFSGREKEASSDIGKMIALDYGGLSKEVANAHKEMLVYQHDLEKAIYGIHNCLGENTRIITTKGIKTFKELNDGEKIAVITHTGKIKNAIVKCYGKRPVYDLTFKRFKTIHHITATDNHRWLLKDGTWTDNIKIGDYLAHAPNVYEKFDYDSLSLEDKKYWCYGFVMGDGTVRYKYSKKQREYIKADDSKLRLCGEKVKYQIRFDECGYVISTQNLGNNDVYIGGIDYNKSIPNINEISYTQLCAFIHGLYDADGGHTNFSKNGSMMYTIQFTGNEICDFVDNVFQSAGLYISRRKEETGNVTNYGTRGYTIEYNFVPNPHRFNYQLIDMKYVGIENVWCLEVEDDNSFVLDGGIVTGNCLNLNFQEIFTYGFRTRNGDVRPPTSFSTACQLVAVAFQCQSQVQFGGVGTIHLDYDLAPFVKMSFRKHMLNYFTDVKDYSKQRAEDILREHEPIEIDNKELCVNPEMVTAYNYAIKQLKKEGKQAAQGLYHNLNTLESRQGSQVPFTSINLGRDTSTEGRLVTKWIMEASLDGIGKHHLTSIFPISIFQYKVGTNANIGDKNYDMKQLALESMSKRIYPNWCNCNWSQAHEDEDNIDTFFATMGCRTLIGYDRHGLGYIRQGRGNNVPNTIVLPKLGIEFGVCLGERTEPDIEGFWNAFEETLKLTEKGLLERFEIMIRQSPKAAPYMYDNNTIQDARECKENVFNALKHNTLAIGYLGIAEMCQALFGKNHAQDADVHAFALSVVKRINEFASEASERNNLNFSCYATPAEGLCRTALSALRKQYGIIENVTSHDYITNSHHVPVWEKVSIYDKLRVEAPFCKYPTGGCITYVELDSTFVKNTKAVEDIIDYAFKELDIPYLAFNFPIDSCLECGYQGEFNNKCPECGSVNIQQLRRVTGYLTTDYRNFNDGKIAEVEERVKHSTYTDARDIK